MKGKPKIAKRNVNESEQYVYKIHIGFKGNLEMEKAIDKYLQETLEQYFLEKGESVEYCYIDEINNVI